MKNPLKTLYRRKVLYLYRRPLKAILFKTKLWEGSLYTEELEKLSYKSGRLSKLFYQHQTCERFSIYRIYVKSVPSIEDL